MLITHNNNTYYLLQISVKLNTNTTARQRGNELCLLKYEIILKYRYYL